MIVPFHNSGVDAANVDARGDAGIFYVLAVDVDLALELRELAVSGAEKLEHRKADLRLCLIEFVYLVRARGAWSAVSAWSLHDYLFPDVNYVTPLDRPPKRFI